MKNPSILLNKIDGFLLTAYRVLDFATIPLSCKHKRKNALSDVCFYYLLSSLPFVVSFFKAFAKKQNTRRYALKIKVSDVCWIGGGGRSRNQHATPTIKTHQFSQFLLIFGCFCIVFYPLSNYL